MKKEKLSIGTKVKITGNSNNHGFEIGDVVEVDKDVTKSADEPGYNLYYCKAKNDTIYSIRDYDIEVVKEETLLEQAKRLYPVGTKFKNAIDRHNKCEHTITKCDPEEVVSGVINISATDGTYGRACIYYKGKWAEIIKEETLLQKAVRMYPVGTKYKCATDNLDSFTVVAQTFKKLEDDIVHGEFGKGCLCFNGVWAEIIKEESKTTNNMSTKQTVTRAQLKKLHSKVCGKWQSRIEETIKSNVFADSYEVSNELLKEAFEEADLAQTAALLKVFTKPGNDYVTLATGNFKPKVFETGDIVIGNGSVPVEFRGKSIIFESSRYEAVIMPNPQKSSELDTMIVFKEK